jgi:hypothetical protein
MKDFFDLLREQSGGDVQEDCRTTDLELTPQQFQFAMLMEEDGERLLHLLFQEEEWKVVARMGLCTFSEDGGKRIRIPRWNNFLSHLRIVADVFDR